MSGRSVLVTGAGGFIGGHLVERLVADGARVRAFCRYNSRDDCGTLGWLDVAVQREIDLVMGDLRGESVAGAVAGVDTVFHLGALIAIPYSYVNARDYFETNVRGTLNVAQAALQHEVRRVVHISTSEIYGMAQTVPVTEEHPLEAQSPYAGSKTGADKLVESFHRSHGLPAVVLRPFNTYGPRQSARAVIPTIITQALAGPTLRLGALDPRRDLTFVADTAAGFVAAAQAEEVVGSTIQLGTGESVSVGEIVDSVGELLGRDLQVEVDPVRIRPPLSEVQLLLSDPARARSVTGWSPRVALRDGLARTITWVEANAGRFRTGEYVT